MTLADIRKVLPLAPQRFLDKIAPDATGCWLWTGVLIPNGYGQFWWNGRMENAHVMAARFSGREVIGGKRGQIVRHSCDVRPCCYPIHLFVGSQAENQADMVSKSRQAFGERHGMAILSEDDVLYILGRHETAPAAAALFGVATATIHDIRQGRRWRHLR